jgi:hypothetical protein
MNPTEKVEFAMTESSDPLFSVAGGQLAIQTMLSVLVSLYIGGL